MNYTHLSGSGTARTGYKNMEITARTDGERAKFNGSLGSDEFCTFSWRGIDGWTNFGAFIINSGDSLSFENGPSFKNTYVQPQFSDSNQILEGISFDNQQISFTIGIYWITEDNYAYLLDWLNPYEKNFLKFGYNNEYGYEVKLSGVQKAPKKFLGYDANNTRAWYTELQLTFDVLGTPCAKKITELSASGNPVMFGSFGIPYLRTPIEVKLTTNSSVTFEADTTYTVIVNDPNEGDMDLFSFTPNVDFTMSSTNSIITYDSETAILYYQATSDSKKQLLSCTITNTQGIRLFKNFNANQFFIRGKFDESPVKLEDYQFSMVTEEPVIIQVSCRPRINVI